MPAQLWDLSSKTILTTFQYLSLFLPGIEQNDCFSLHLRKAQYFFLKHGDTHNLEAVGGSGATDAIRVDDATVEARRRLIHGARFLPLFRGLELTSS